MIDEHLQAFAGLQVVHWSPGDVLADPAHSAYRISVEWDAEIPWTDRFEQFLSLPGASRVAAFLVGTWANVATGDPPDLVVEALVGARNRLPALRALFLGDILAEESEISWIVQSDLAPILSAYPELEELRVRGGRGLSLGRLSHAGLRRLTIESGGLDRSVVAQVASAELPSLLHLELWLGSDDYGANTTVADLAGILDGQRFGKLETLALRNCHYADDLAKAVATAPMTSRVRNLDLSLGTLTDEGASALLAAPAISRLERLDLHYHYLSDEMMEKLGALPIETDLDDQNEADEDDGTLYRYVAFGE